MVTKAQKKSPADMAEVMLSGAMNVAKDAMQANPDKAGSIAANIERAVKTAVEPDAYVFMRLTTAIPGLADDDGTCIYQNEAGIFRLNEDPAAVPSHIADRMDTNFPGHFTRGKKVTPKELREMEMEDSKAAQKTNAAEVAKAKALREQEKAGKAGDKGKAGEPGPTGVGTASASGPRIQ